MKWASSQGGTIQYIQPGQPQQTACIERYNRTVRHEWLDQYIIETIEPYGDCVQSPTGQREAQDHATQWLVLYQRPFGLTLSGFPSLAQSESMQPEGQEAGMAGIAITRRELTAVALRRAAGRSKGARAARRMLAIALVVEGVDRATAAQTCGMDRQTLRGEEGQETVRGAV